MGQLEYRDPEQSRESVHIFVAETYPSAVQYFAHAEDVPWTVAFAGFVTSGRNYQAPGVVAGPDCSIQVASRDGFEVVACAFAA